MIDCSRIQAALSARLDGEDPLLDDDIIDAHVSQCQACQDFYEQAARLNRRLSLSPATPTDPPDLAEAILAEVEPAWRRHSTTRSVSVAFARVALVLVGVGWMLWAVHVLNRSGAAEYDEEFLRLIVEVAATRCALGFGLLYCTWQVRSVGPVVPLYGALWMLNLGFSARDIVTGTVGIETGTRLVLLGLSVAVLAWLWLADKGWQLVRSQLASLGSQPVV